MPTPLSSDDTSYGSHQCSKRQCNKTIALPLSAMIIVINVPSLLMLSLWNISHTCSFLLFHLRRKFGDVGFKILCYSTVPNLIFEPNPPPLLDYFDLSSFRVLCQKTTKKISKKTASVWRNVQSLVDLVSYFYIHGIFIYRIIIVDVANNWFYLRKNNSMS